MLCFAIEQPIEQMLNEVIALNSIDTVHFPSLKSQATPTNKGWHKAYKDGKSHAGKRHEKELFASSEPDMMACIVQHE